MNPVSVVAQALSVRTPDGLMDATTFRPDAAGTHPVVILYMDAIGIRPALASMATRLAAAGCCVLLPNLFYRSGPLPAVKLDEFVRPGPERDRVFALIESIDGVRVMRDTASLLAAAADLPYAGTRVATVGYCMGGAYALRAAAAFPDRVAVAAAVHASRLATDADDSPHRLAHRITARVYVGVAEHDHMFGEDERERLRAALAGTGLRFEIEVYAGMRHGFAVTGHPVYDAAGAEHHWQRLLQLLRESLPGFGV